MNAPDYDIREGYPLAHCEEAWQKHRVICRWCWVLFLGWMPFGVLVVAPLSRFVSLLHVPGWVVVFPLFAYLLAIFVLSSIQNRFRCPRCGSRFYQWGYMGLGHNGFARKCGNCKLRKWQCFQIPQEPSDYKEPVPGGIVIRPRR